MSKRGLSNGDYHQTIAITGSFRYIKTSSLAFPVSGMGRMHSRKGFKLHD